MKIVRINLLHTIAEPDLPSASESLSFDAEHAATSPRVRYVVVVAGIADSERRILTLQDENGVVVDMSTTFQVDPSQLATTDLTVTIEFTSARIPRGAIRCVRVADLAARPAQPLAS